MRLLALVACLIPTFSGAQDLETQSGPLRFVDVETDGLPTQEIRVGETRIDIDTYAQFLWVEYQHGTQVLIGVAMGGNACPASFVWLETAAGKLAATPSFGTCSDLIEVTEDERTVTVTMPEMTGSGDRYAFVYDGQTVAETVAPRLPSGIPPGSGAEAWIGRYPFEILQASDWEPALTDLLGTGALNAAREIIALAGPMVVEGDWVVGTGCIKVSCDTDRGAVAIHIGDERLLVAIRALDMAPQVWGDVADAPPSLTDVLTR